MYKSEYLNLFFSSTFLIDKLISSSNSIGKRYLFWYPFIKLAPTGVYDKYIDVLVIAKTTKNDSIKINLVLADKCLLESVTLINNKYASITINAL